MSFRLFQPQYFHIMMVLRSGQLFCESISRYIFHRDIFNLQTLIRYCFTYEIMSNDNMFTSWFWASRNAPVMSLYNLTVAYLLKRNSIKKRLRYRYSLAASVRLMYFVSVDDKAAFLNLLISLHWLTQTKNQCKVACPPACIHKSFQRFIWSSIYDLHIWRFICNPHFQRTLQMPSTRFAPVPNWLRTLTGCGMAGLGATAEYMGLPMNSR